MENDSRAVCYQCTRAYQVVATKEPNYTGLFVSTPDICPFSALADYYVGVTQPDDVGVTVSDDILPGLTNAIE